MGETEATGDYVNVGIQECPLLPLSLPKAMRRKDLTLRWNELPCRGVGG